MFIVCILAFNLILEVLLKGLIFQLNSLQLVLEHCHVLLLLKQFSSHVCKSMLLIFLYLLHALVYGILPVVELFVLSLQVDETFFKCLDSHVSIIVTDILVACPFDNFLKELCVLAQISELTLPLVKFLLLAIYVLTELLNILLVLYCCLVQLLESGILLFPLRLVLLDLLFVGSDGR